MHLGKKKRELTSLLLVWLSYESIVVPEAAVISPWFDVSPHSLRGTIWLTSMKKGLD